MDGVIDPGGWAALTEVVKDVGVIGILVGLVVAWLRGILHSDREFQDERADKVAAQADAKAWQDMAIELLRQTDRATTIAEKVARS